MSNVKIVSLDFSGNSNDWKIVINNKAIHDEVFFSPLSKKLHCSTALITCWTSSSSVWIKLFVRQTLKSFIQSPLLRLSFLFENAKRTSCLTKTSLPQIMLNECWQAKSDAANISRSVFEWSPISQDISKYLTFVFDFLSMSLYICSVFMDLCWLIGGSLSNGILNIWLSGANGIRHFLSEARKWTFYQN